MEGNSNLSSVRGRFVDHKQSQPQASALGQLLTGTVALSVH